MIVIDNLMAFYIILAILTLGFAIMVTFGKTKEDEPARRNRKSTTTTS